MPMIVRAIGKSRDNRTDTSGHIALREMLARLSPLAKISPKAITLINELTAG